MALSNRNVVFGRRRIQNSTSCRLGVALLAGVPRHLGFRRRVTRRYELDDVPQGRAWQLLWQFAHTCIRTVLTRQVRTLQAIQRFY